MSSWLGWLLILAGVYVVVVAVRAIIELSTWFIEEFFSADEGEEEAAATEHSETHAANAADTHSNQRSRGGSYVNWILIFAARMALIHWFAAVAEFARSLVYRRRYDYWIGRGLAEDKPGRKVKYLSKALALNPGYVPGWGLQANALIALARYAEALACLEKILELAPSPVAWYEKGLCCRYLRRYEEAIKCFDKALAQCSDKNIKLREEVRRNRAATEEEMERSA
jgi:tetratricopeptide (TPR) repeat protein